MTESTPDETVDDEGLGEAGASGPDRTPDPASEAELPALRSELDKDVWAAVVELVADGWRIERQGHKIRLYCPCGAGGAAFSLGGTVRSGGHRANQLRRNLKHCPEKHGLVK
jgi:hypothetical protein